MPNVMSYEVRLYRSEEGYAVSCPALPGCWSQGDTEEEALENIKDAIREYLLVSPEVEKEGFTRRVEVLV
jgi:predicted RNase H-like HicB family nuclease